MSRLAKRMLGILVVSVVVLMVASSIGIVHATWTWYLLDGGGSPNKVALTSYGNFVYLAARSADGRIWIRSVGCPLGGTCTGWTAWTLVPGLTDAPLALIVFNTHLYIFAKQAGANNIWYGSWDVTSGSPGFSIFTGWTLLPGSTPAAVSLATDGPHLYVVAEGMDNRIWYQSFDTSTWSGWVLIPGLTDVSPAIIAFNNGLWFFCKQKASSNIWYGFIPLSGFYVWSWTLLPGPTPTAVSLATQSSYLYVAAEGMDGRIWTQTYHAMTWYGWSQIPGYTDTTPATTWGYFDFTIVAKQQGSNNLWSNL